MQTRRTTLKKAIDYARKLRLRHLKKALTAGAAAAGLSLGKVLVIGGPVPRWQTLVLLGVGTALVTFFAPANAPAD